MLSAGSLSMRFFATTEQDKEQTTDNKINRSVFFFSPGFKLPNSRQLRRRSHRLHHWGAAVETRVCATKTNIKLRHAGTYPGDHARADNPYVSWAVQKLGAKSARSKQFELLPTLISVLHVLQTPPFFSPCPSQNQTRRS